MPPLAQGSCDSTHDKGPLELFLVTIQSSSNKILTKCFMIPKFYDPFHFWLRKQPNKS